MAVPHVQFASCRNCLDADKFDYLQVCLLPHAKLGDFLAEVMAIGFPSCKLREFSWKFKEDGFASCKLGEVSCKLGEMGFPTCKLEEFSCKLEEIGFRRCLPGNLFFPQTRGIHL